MRAYVVFKMADRRGAIEPVLIGVFLDKSRADEACPPDNRRRRNGTWGLVRSTELDLSGTLDQAAVDALREVAG